MIRKFKTGLLFSLAMLFSSCTIGTLMSSCDTNDSVNKCNCPECGCNKPPVLEPVVEPEQDKEIDQSKEGTTNPEKVYVTINNNVDSTSMSDSKSDSEANAKNVVMTYTKQLDKKCLAHYKFKEIECDKTIWCDTPPPPKPPVNPPKKPKKQEFPGKQKKCVSKGTYQQQQQQKTINFTDNGCGGNDTEVLFF